MNPKLIQALEIIHQQFTAENLHWAIGGSLLLNTHQLHDTVLDIDLIVTIKDVQRAQQLLAKLGHQKPLEPTREPFRTVFYRQYFLKDIPVDLMAGLSLQHEAGTFQYPFHENTPIQHRYYHGNTYPFGLLEDWYILYQLLGRVEKVHLIENHFKKWGLTHPRQLRLLLKENIPPTIKTRVNNLLEFTNA